MKKSSVYTFVVGLSLACQLSFAQTYWRSQVTRGWSMESDGEIVDENIKATIYPTHLDVTVEQKIRPGNFWNNLSEDQNSTIEMVGTLNLPKDAVITGALIWNGNDILKAKLRSSSEAREKYEQVVERNLETTPRDPILLEKTGENTYEFAVYPFNINQIRKIRYRYTVPVRLEKGQYYAELPYRNLPKESFELQGIGVENISLVQENPNLGRSEILNTENRKIRYLPTIVKSEFSLLTLEKGGSRSIHTSFNHLDVQGDLLGIQSSIPDSILIKIGKKCDFLVLWYWNPSPGLLENQDRLEEIKTGIGSLLQQLNPSLHRGGILLDPGTGNLSSYGLGVPETPGMEQMLDAFEIGFQGAISRELNYWQNSPSEKQIDSLRTMGLSRFNQHLKTARTIFSSDTSRTRYLIVVTSGKAWLLSDESKWPTLATNDIHLLGIKNAKHFWPGVQIGKMIQMQKPAITRTVDIGFEIPFEKPVDISISAQAGDHITKVKVVDSKQEQIWNQAWVDLRLHSGKGTWSNSITWSANRGDSVIATYNEKLKPILEADATGLAQTWFGGSFLVSNNLDVTQGFGPLLGFVDDNYSLLALESDRLSEVDKKLYTSSGIPLLAQGDIFIDPKSSTARLNPLKSSETEFELPTSLANKLLLPEAWLTVLRTGSVITIDWSRFPESEREGLQLEILDIKGKVIHKFRPRAGENTFSSENGNLGQGNFLSGQNYFLRVSNFNHQWVKMIPVH